MWQNRILITPRPEVEAICLKLSAVLCTTVYTSLHGGLIRSRSLSWYPTPRPTVSTAVVTRCRMVSFLYLKNNSLPKKTLSTKNFILDISTSCSSCSSMNSSSSSSSSRSSSSISSSSSSSSSISNISSSSISSSSSSISSSNSSSSSSSSSISSSSSSNCILWIFFISYRNKFYYIMVTK